MVRVAIMDSKQWTIESISDQKIQSNLKTVSLLKMRITLCFSMRAIEEMEMYLCLGT